MSKTLLNPRGQFVGLNGVVSVGILQFLDGDTDVTAPTWYDRELTTLAPEFVPIDANGFAPQIWGNIYYKVRQYQQLAGTLGTFPEDYAFVREWFWDATEEAPISAPVDAVETMADLKALQPVDGDLVTLLGYYGVGDSRMRTFRFYASSTDTPNDGNRVRPNSYGAGVWIDDSADYIDARDFGCSHPTDQKNGNLAQAISYANSEGIEIKFPPAIYNLGAGTATINAPCTIEAGAFFNVSGYPYTLSIADRFKLPVGVNIGTQVFVLDLVSSPHIALEGISPEIYWATDSVARLNAMSLHCGASGLSVVGTLNIPTGWGGSYSIDFNRVVFGVAGEIEFDSTISECDLTIGRVEIQGRVDEVSLFTVPDNDFSSRLKIGGDVMSSWFEEGGVSSEMINNVCTSEGILYINNSVVCDASKTFGKVAPAGGSILSSGSSTVTTLTVVGTCEKWLKCSGGTFVGTSDARAFELDTVAKIEGYIASCNAQGGRADFAGISTSGNISVGDAKITGMRHSSGTVTGGMVELSFCNFGGACTFAQSLVNNCYFGSTVALGVAGTRVDHIWTDNRVLGTVSITAGTGDILRRVIFLHNVNIGTGTPLDVSGLLCNAFDANGIIDVRRNSPECFKDTSVPVGAWAQTYLDLQISATATPSAKTATFDISSKAYALKLANIAQSFQRWHASNWNSNIVGSFTDAGCSSHSITLESNVDFTSGGRTIRVTGNLY